jgi:hypothetical protein
MKNLKVPYLPALDVLDLSSVGFLLETKSQRMYIDVANWPEYPYRPIAAFDVARSDLNLYIRFFVRGNSLKALYEEDNSPVHKDSCVEFFMKKTEDDSYMNFEFNCIGACDAARRTSRERKSSLSEEEYASIRRYTSLESKAFQEKKGLHEWGLVVAIPLSLMGLEADNLPEKILGNFYKCADDTEAPHFLSWNPIAATEPDFHRPDSFGEIFLR